MNSCYTLCMPEEIRWHGNENRGARKDVLWQAGAVGLALILLTIALVQHNFFFAIFVVLAAALMIARSRRKPETLEFSVTDKGIGIGKSQFYPYDNLEWFAARERGEKEGELVVKRNTTFSPYVKIPVERERLEAVKTLVREHLEEGEYEPSLLDVILEKLGL